MTEKIAAEAPIKRSLREAVTTLLLAHPVYRGLLPGNIARAGQIQAIEAEDAVREALVEPGRELDELMDSLRIDAHIALREFYRQFGDACPIATNALERICKMLDSICAK